MEHLADLETWAIMVRASWKLLTIWWPMVLLGVSYCIYETYFMGVK